MLPLIDLFFCGGKNICREILLMMFNEGIHHGLIIRTPLTKQEVFLSKNYF